MPLADLSMKTSLLLQRTVPTTSDGNESARDCEGTSDGSERSKPVRALESFVGTASRAAKAATGHAAQAATAVGSVARQRLEGTARKLVSARPSDESAAESLLAPKVATTTSSQASKAATVASSTARQGFELAKGKLDSVRRATTTGHRGAPVATPLHPVVVEKLTSEQEGFVHVLIDLGMTKERAQHAVRAGIAETLVEAAFVGNLSSALLQVGDLPGAPTAGKHNRFDVKRRAELMLGLTSKTTPQSPYLAIGRQHMLLEEFSLKRVLEESRLEAEYEQVLKSSLDDAESVTGDVAAVPHAVSLEPDMRSPGLVLVGGKAAEQGIWRMRSFRHMPSVGTWMTLHVQSI